ncbi:MAG: class I SAM-dependent methyltransferase, partial [Actinomycetota bacterium]
MTPTDLDRARAAGQDGADGSPNGPDPATSVLDLYRMDLPTPATAIDIFAGDWSSVLPDQVGVDTGGFAPLFTDARIDWMVEVLGGVDGQRILELGPLEGGHTWALEVTHGADEIVAIEANQRAYLRCLVAKEILRTARSRFLLGDFNRYLAESGERFDLVVACGVLYHMEDPARHIALCCSAADTVFVWTHYYDERIRANPNLDRKFGPPVEVVTDGVRHTLHRQDYLDALGWGGFCGAGRPSANWLDLDDITALFEHNGFVITDTAFHNPDHE